LSAVKIHTTSTTKTKTKQKSYGEKTKIEKWRRSICITTWKFSQFS